MGVVVGDGSQDHILHAAEPHYYYQNLEDVLEEIFLLLLCKLLIIFREF